MGQELECTMRLRRRILAGRAQLETDYLLFRSPPDERLKILFKDLTGVSAAGGVLHLKFPGGSAEFELGKTAAKWAEKILHPPSRLDKLGVKPGLTVRIIGTFEDAFRRELRERDTTIRDDDAPAGLVIFAAEAAADLKRIPHLISGLDPAGALWVVYPKGVTVIREIDVLNAGREAGLKDVKVARFSATHTALKFVVPVAARYR